MTIKILTQVESMNPIYLGAISDSLYGEILKEHSGRTYAEVKEDGYRMQLHKKGKKVVGYTRSGNQVELALFPELSLSISNLPNSIIDCELIGNRKIGHDGFNVVKRRFRHRISKEGIENYLASGICEQMPVGLVVFDCLHWEDKELVDKPLEFRREYVERINERKIRPSELNKVYSSEELQRLFERLVESHYEGLVCKNPSSLYLSGQRTNDWIKLKRSESLDLVVLGVYLEEKRISQILCGTYNESSGKYETLCKVNAKREGLDKELDQLLKPNYLKECPENLFLNPQIHKNSGGIPDFYIKPESLVVEICAMNFQRTSNWHSCGYSDKKSYSLRIAWLKRIRQDKSVKNVTTTSQVKVFYENQGVE